tara:strand:- start:5781 stop:6914 length:1134 start_codon:yes stop_codon:yes gene_type:complete
MKNLILLGILISFISCNQDTKNEIAEQWSIEKAWAWYDGQPWLVGTNFNPSTSINQLEFWQEETFDIEVIERELSWSADLGMNIHRVYLHNLLWQQDSIGFLNRVEQYLSISDKYNIKTMLVLLDDVWHPVPKLGKQPAPMPHVHNSGWVQAPGAAILGDTLKHDELEGYIKGVIRKFSNDDRVIVWDLYNEPDNVARDKGRKELEVKNKHIYTLALLKKVVKWARKVNPSQPLTTGLWRGDVNHWGTPDSLPELDKYMVENADVISFHTYDGDMKVVNQKINELKKYGRPLLCTEYLARGVGNTFESVLPIFKENKIGAINWGLVSGKTNTIYPWETWRKNYTSKPEVWHHDIFKKDGKPYSEEEVKFISYTIRGD